MPQSTGRNASKKTQSCQKISTELEHPSSARSKRPRSNLFKTGFDLQSESRERDRIWFRLYLCQTISKHFARLHLDTSHIWWRAPLLQEECFQLDVSRFTSSALELDHTQRCRGITTQDLLRLICLLRIASKLQLPVPLLSQAHAFTGSRECSDQLSLTTAECDRRLFSARRGDRVPTKFASQP